MTRAPISLVNASGDTVQAWTHDAITDSDLDDWETHWKPYLATLKATSSSDASKPLLESSHWDWRSKARRRTTLANQGFTVVCGNTLQGMMFVESTTHRCHVDTQRGKDLIYIEYLESAPWNQVALNNPPRYWGVGSALVTAAVKLSAQEGFKGRIGLHSLPQAQSFYKRFGMDDLGPGYGYPRLSYFELTEQAASSLLSKVSPSGGI